MILSFSDRLEFAELDHEPRIYVAAPSGVPVIKLTAFGVYDPGLIPLYRLHSDYLKPGDYENFQVNSESGKLSTRRYIDRPVGSVYNIIVVAYSKGESKYKHLKICVTEYNKYSPYFRTQNYKVNVELIMSVGHPITQVQAVDKDEQPYNAEVYYNLQSRTSLISINKTTGVINLQQNLSPRYRDLVFTVIAYDGGSPKRVGKTRLTMTVKIISAPHDIVVAQTGDRWAMLCWLPSSNGNPLGYIIYLISETDFMTSPVAPAPFVTTQHNITREELGQRDNRICTALTDLESWSDFEARLAGWDTQEIGMVSQPVTFDTRVNRSCYNLDNSNFKCTCLAGFYGEDCLMFNPCSSTISPCLNGGTCISIANNQYECSCPPRFKGNSCEIFNPCSQSVCENGGVCYNTSKTLYGCKCLTGFTGTLCETKINECSSEPCQNGGHCVDDVGAFRCVCSSGFEGEYCQEETNECTSSLCKNGGTCFDAINDYKCNCLPRFTGKTCDTEIDLCASNPCNNGGICVKTSYSYHCQCPQGYKGHNCQSKEKCFSETINSSIGTITWPEVDFGSTVKLECPHGINNETFLKADSHSFVHFVFNSEKFLINQSKLSPNGNERYMSSVVERENRQKQFIETNLKHYEKAYALRSCLLLNGSATWGVTMNDACIEEDLLAAEQICQHIANLTKFPSQMKSDMFIDAAAHLHRILLFSLTDIKIAQSLITIISNIMEVNNSVLEAADKDGSISQELINIINTFTREVNLQQNLSITLSSVNLHINVTLITDPSSMKNHRNGISYSPSYITKMSQNFKDNLHSESQRISINIPKEAIQQAVGKHSARIQFVSYRNQKLFRPLGKVSLFSKYSDNVKEQVITASIGDIPVYNLKNPIVYTMLNTNGKQKLICVYWDGEGMYWLTTGIITNQTEDWVVCTSTHLTAFSVLLDLQPHLKLPPAHEVPLSLISFIGVVFSIVGLLLTILTYSLFRCLDRNHSGKILLNLCTSMLFMNISFLMLSIKDYTEYKQDVCLIVAVSTHYFVLTTLAWMSVEAMNMYQLLITVYATSETHFMAKRLLLTWGVPMCIVAGTIYHGGLSYYMSRDPDWCLFSPPNMTVYYITYTGPACLLIFTNTIIFFMLTQVLCQRRDLGKNISKKQGLTKTQVRGSFTVMVLLGVTWIPGIFTVGDLRLTFQYAFCITNSLQGLIIFVVRCIISTEVRNVWMNFLRTGQLKMHHDVIPGGYRESHPTSFTSQFKQSTISFEQQWRVRPKNNYEKHTGLMLDHHKRTAFYSTVALSHTKQSTTAIIGSCIGRSKSLHMQDINSKEGEGTSWQFLAPVSSIAQADQGYGTAEPSPESPLQQPRRQANSLRFSVSIPEKLHSPSPKHLVTPICSRSDSDIAQSSSVSLRRNTIFHYTHHNESGSTTTEPQSSLCSNTSPCSTSSSNPATLPNYSAQIWRERYLVNNNSHKVCERSYSEELL